MKLDLTEQEINLMVNQLAQGKYIEVAPLINRIAEQIKAQKEPPKKKEEENSEELNKDKDESTESE